MIVVKSVGQSTTVNWEWKSAVLAMKRMVAYLLVSLGWTTPLPGDLVLPADGTIQEVVDLCIDARLEQSDTVAARPADDGTLIRRTTLDLLGRIPAAWEVRNYMTSPAVSKRVPT